MKLASRHRHRRAAFLAITRVIMINESKRDRDAVEWEAMRRQAQELAVPARPATPSAACKTAALPVCSGAGHTGAV
jgi:hypothetical protein